MTTTVFNRKDIPIDLSQVDRPPKRLWIKGHRPVFEWFNSKNALAVVGSRKPSARTGHLMHQVFKSLRNSSLTILSGLARGVDARAHELALQNGLRTIAFLGHGVDRCYPRENARLQQAILEAGGALISEWPSETEAMPHQFILRNRLIAAFSRAVWMVEGNARSGALGTVRYALDQDKTIYATPSFPGDPSFAGCELLLHEGIAKCLWSAQSLGATWLDLSTCAENRGDTDSLSISLQKKLIEEGPVTLEKIHDWADEWKVHPAQILERLPSLTGQ